MTFRNVLHANGGKVMIPSSRIWGSVQRNIPSSRRHGDGHAFSRIKGRKDLCRFANRSTCRGKSISLRVGKVLYILHACGADLDIVNSVESIKQIVLTRGCKQPARHG